MGRGATRTPGTTEVEARTRADGTCDGTRPGPSRMYAPHDPGARRPPASPPRIRTAKARRTRAHHTNSADGSNQAPRTRPPGHAPDTPSERRPTAAHRSNDRGCAHPPADGGPGPSGASDRAAARAAPAVRTVSPTVRPAAGGAPTESRGVPGRRRAGFARGVGSHRAHGVGSGGGSQTSSPTGTGSGAGSRDSGGGVRTRSARRSDHWPLFSPRANSPSLSPWISDVPAGA